MKIEEENSFSFWQDPKKRLALIAASAVLLLSVCLLILHFALPSPAKEPSADADPTGSSAETAAGTEPAQTADLLDPEKGKEKTGASVQGSSLTKKSGLANGIDVSKWQGAIDWKAVRESGVDFAIIRLGYRAENGVIYEDDTAVYNLQQAEKNGVLTGVYFFSGATNAEEAGEEARWVLARIAGFAISYPVVFDAEQKSGASLSAAARTETALRFLSEIQNAGYEAMLYTLQSEFENPALWNADSLLSRFPVWIARFPDPTYPAVAYPATEKDYAMWQYTDRGEVAGVSGEVDFNVSYFVRSYTAPKDLSQRPEEAAPPEEFAQSFSTVSQQVTAKDEVNLRKTPSIHGEIVGQLRKGDFLHCTGISDMGWSRLEYQGQIVYAVTSYLTTELIEEPEPIPEDWGSFQTVNDRVTAKEEVNLRRTPDRDGEWVGSLKNGEYLTRTGIGSKGWSRLEYRGQTVYALTQYLMTENGETFVPEQTYRTVAERVTAKEEVNLRRTASTEGEIVGVLKNGEYLTRTGIGDKGWSRLEYRGQTVYAVTSYLMTEAEANAAAPAAPAAPTALSAPVRGKGALAARAFGRNGRDFFGHFVNKI